MEFIVGKTSVDQLSSVPLVDFDYNLMKASNRLLKRTFDIVLSLPGVLLLYPLVSLFRSRSNPGPFARFVLGLPDVLIGRRSLVGYDPEYLRTLPEVYLGKPGLTGLAQLRSIEQLTEDEVLSIAIQYVRNYSIFLDESSHRLFGYAEIESEERWNAIAGTEVCKRWWAHMSDVMPSNSDNSPVSIELREVFHLD